jgi:hypothetical protein
MKITFDDNGKLGLAKQIAGATAVGPLLSKI